MGISGRREGGKGMGRLERKGRLEKRGGRVFGIFADLSIYIVFSRNYKYEEVQSIVVISIVINIKIK